MHVWTEHTNPEGRTYWFNTGTRESVWEKPDEFKTPFERALNQTKWKEYFSGGRKYYYHTETKESKWDMPDELLLVLEKVEKETANQPPPTAVPTIADNPAANTSTALVQHTGITPTPFTPTSILPTRPNLPDDPVIPHNGFATVEEGEKAFAHLLRKAGVDASWTWDQTMRAIITDPLYKALNTLAEKKAVWQSFTEGLRVKEHEERQARLAKLRPALRNMLKGNPSVFHYTTFATADKLFAAHPTWQQGKIEAERKLIFEEYVQELKQRDVQETRAARSRSIAKVVSLFKQLNVDVLTRWKDAHKLIEDSPEWIQDEELRKLPTLDVLLAFEDYSRVREREYEDQMRRNQVEKTRRERKAREAFKELLQELVSSNTLKARTKWKEIYPLFATDDRYLNMLGNPGSNPLELFWDVVDALDQNLDEKIALALEAIDSSNLAKEAEVAAKAGKDGEAAMDDGKDATGLFEIVLETTLEAFLEVVKPDPTVVKKGLTDHDLETVFKTLRDQAVKKHADEKRRAERKQRHLQDDLRYALKKLPDTFDVAMTYEAAVPLIESLPEYKALDDEEGRRAAFAKFMKRQKERIREAAASEDGASATSRKRKEPNRDHDRDRGDKDSSHRDRDRDRSTKDYDRTTAKEYSSSKDHDASRSSRHHRRGGAEDDYDATTAAHGHRSSSTRDYTRDRDRSDKDVDYSRSSKPHDSDRRRSERDRRGSRADRDDSAHGGKRDRERERERSSSVADVPREKRDTYEDRTPNARAEKKQKLDRDTDADGDGRMEDAMGEEQNAGSSSTNHTLAKKPTSPAKMRKAGTHSEREETPEEGEI